MELPAYHAPRFKNLMLHLWDKTKHFVKKAFTIILVSTILIWVLTHFDFSWTLLGDEGIVESILASVSKLVQPLFTPLGFGSQIGRAGWVFVLAAVTGLIAKENVISTFGVIAASLLGHALAEDESGVSYVAQMIAETGITVPGLLAFIAFNMTTIPCFAAVGTAKGELGSKKRYNWTLLFWLATSYIVGAMIYTVGTWWWTLLLWLIAAALTIVAVRAYGKSRAKGEKLL